MERADLLAHGITMYRRTRRSRRGKKQAPPAPMLRFAALLSILIVSLAACLSVPQSSLAPVTPEIWSAIICASQEAALEDQQAAKDYLTDLVDRLGTDPAATREAADLVGRIQECL